MPIIKTDDGCAHQCRGRRSGQRAGADPVELARHRPAHVGRPGAGAVAAVPAGALRPPRPRRVRRAEGRLYDGPARPRRAGDRRRARRQDLQLVRPFDGRHGRTMARRQRARPGRAADPVEHALLLRRQDSPGTSAWPSRSDKGLAALAPMQMERWFTKGFREQHAVGDRPDRDHVRAHAARRIPRLLRGGARHGLPAVDADDQGADAGDRRQPRSRDTALRRRGNPRA